MEKKLFRMKRLGVGGLLATLGLVPMQAVHADQILFEGKDAIPSVIGYLRLDAGYRVVSDADLAQYQSNTAKAGKSSTLVQAGGNDWGTSMYGIKGSSQLTPELEAVYKLEGGFNATTGDFNSSQNSLFNRRAYGGVSNAKLGTIYFGKDLFIDNDIWDFDPMVQENMSSATLVNGRNWQGSSNMVEYRSPNWGGLHLGGQAEFSSGTTSGANGATITSTRVSNAYGVSARYDIKALSLFAIYDEITDGNGHLSNLYTSSREVIGGATLDLQPVKFFVGYEHLSAPDGHPNTGNAGTATNSLNYGGGTSYNNAYGSVFATNAAMEWGGLQVQASDNLVVRGAWFHTNINDNAGSANLFTAGLEYYLSKNVFVYLTGAEVANSGKAAFSADIGAATPAPGKDQFVGINGISISF